MLNQDCYYIVYNHFYLHWFFYILSTLIKYLYDVMCIVLCSVPAAQTHTMISRFPSRTRLGCKQEVLWVEVVCGWQGDVRWCKTVEIPVNTNAVDITCCLHVTQNLQQGREVDSIICILMNIFLSLFLSTQHLPLWPSVEAEVGCHRVL